MAAVHPPVRNAWSQLNTNAARRAANDHVALEKAEAGLKQFLYSSSSCRSECVKQPAEAASNMIRYLKVSVLYFGRCFWLSRFVHSLWQCWEHSAAPYIRPGSQLGILMLFLCMPFPLESTGAQTVRLLVEHALRKENYTHMHRLALGS